MGCTAYCGSALSQADIDAALHADVVRRHGSKRRSSVVAMVALDINVLVCCLMMDDPSQVPVAKALLAHRDGVFIAKTVLVELEWFCAPLAVAAADHSSGPEQVVGSAESQRRKPGPGQPGARWLRTRPRLRRRPAPFCQHGRRRSVHLRSVICQRRNRSRAQRPRGRRVAHASRLKPWTQRTRFIPLQQPRPLPPRATAQGSRNAARAAARRIEPCLVGCPTSAGRAGPGPTAPRPPCGRPGPSSS